MEQLFPFFFFFYGDLLAPCWELAGGKTASPPHETTRLDPLFLETGGSGCQWPVAGGEGGRSRDVENIMRTGGRLHAFSRLGVVRFESLFHPSDKHSSESYVGVDILR